MGLVRPRTKSAGSRDDSITRLSCTTRNYPKSGGDKPNGLRAADVKHRGANPNSTALISRQPDEIRSQINEIKRGSFTGSLRRSGGVRKRFSSSISSLRVL
ncbi:hypothetical protein MHYP_G00005900 [Metynnis hypsauchen]